MIFHFQFQLLLWEIERKKVIFGIWDLTKMWCGIRENANYLDGKQDLTATWEAGFTKIYAQNVGFFNLAVQRPKRVVSDSLGLVDFAIRPVNSVINWQKNCEINLLIKTFFGLVEMVFGLVKKINVSFS